MQNPVATELFAYIEDKLQGSSIQEKRVILYELFQELENKYDETGYEEDEDEESAGADL